MARFHSFLWMSISSLYILFDITSILNLSSTHFWKCSKFIFRHYWTAVSSSFNSSVKFLGVFHNTTTLLCYHSPYWLLWRHHMIPLSSASSLAHLGGVSLLGWTMQPFLQRGSFKGESPGLLEGQESLFLLKLGQYFLSFSVFKQTNKNKFSIPMVYFWDT